MDITYLEQTLEDNLNNKHDFLSHLKKIIAVGVRHYCVDLQEKKVTYHSQDQQAQVCFLPQSLDLSPQPLWRPEALRAALAAIQNKQITYVQFLQSIAQAGVQKYRVELLQKRALYFNREDIPYTESFPQTLCKMLEELL